MASSRKSVAAQFFMDDDSPAPPGEPSSSNNRQSRIAAGSMIATREPLGGYPDHLKYQAAGSA